MTVKRDQTLGEAKEEFCAEVNRLMDELRSAFPVWLRRRSMRMVVHVLVWLSKVLRWVK